MNSERDSSRQVPLKQPEAKSDELEKSLSDSAQCFSQSPTQTLLYHPSFTPAPAASPVQETVANVNPSIPTEPANDPCLTLPGLQPHGSPDTAWTDEASCKLKSRTPKQYRMLLVVGLTLTGAIAVIALFSMQMNGTKGNQHNLQLSPSTATPPCSVSSILEPADARASNSATRGSVDEPAHLSHVDSVATSLEPPESGRVQRSNVARASHSRTTTMTSPTNFMQRPATPSQAALLAPTTNSGRKNSDPMSQRR